MYYQDHKQLSLIAEDDVEYDYCDWSIDTNPSPELRISIEAVREYFERSGSPATHGGQIKNRPPHSALHDGGQPQTRILSMEGNGGQIKNPPLNSALHDGGQIKKRLDPVISPSREPRRTDHGNQTRHSLFEARASSYDDRSRGSEGTWIEKQNRKTGIFEYLRWREGKTKRSKYLGKVA